MNSMKVTFDGDKVITPHLNGHTIRTDQHELCLVKKTINNPPKFEVVTSIK